MNNVVFLLLVLQAAHLFSFPILEKGVGPWSYDPTLASNQSTWFVSWNQEGNIAGPIAYSFFDLDTKKMSASMRIPGVTGIKPKVKLNNLDRGTFLINTTKGSLLSSSFRGLPPHFTSKVEVNNTGDYPSDPDFDFLDNSCGFCVFKDASSQIFYSFYDVNQEAFVKAESIQNSEVGNTLLCSAVAEKPLIVFSDLGKSQLFYAFYNQKRQRFNPFEVIKGSEGSCNARISVNKEGKGILTWNTGAPTSLAGKVGFSLLDASSETFSEAVFIEEETKGFNPTVQINNEGSALLCWTRLTSNGKNGLAYAFFDKEKKAFEKPGFISDASIYPNNCQVCLNDDNDAILCWFATLSGRIEYAIFDPISKNFSSALFIKESGINSQFPKINLKIANALMVWSVFGGVEYAYFDKYSKKFTSARQILSSTNAPNDALNKHQQR